MWGLERCGFESEKFKLVKGDISETSKSFYEDKPGARISLLYLDLDLEIPTYNVLVNLYDKIVDGGIIVFDEYAYHIWSEANAVDKFLQEYPGAELKHTFIKAPTAYIQINK